MKQTAYIIGFGRLGSHLFYALKKSGLCKNVYAKKSSEEKISGLKLKESKIIFICTEDENITAAVNEIAESNTSLKGKFIFHTSGALTADILSPLEKKGAYTGSFHPVQTFEQAVKKFNNRFSSISIAIEGDKKAVAEGVKIARAMNSFPFYISSKNKTLHHICCVEASNYLVSHFKHLSSISRKISGKGIDKKILKIGFNNRSFFDIYKPLILQTLQNISNKGITGSLTGPIERNDFKTIELHLKTLKEQLPDVIPHYIVMGIETVKVALEKGSLNEREADKMVNLLKSYKK